jgi:hypothetical protein|tara:strand:+ start:1222 stop:1428 length:207 start_codon:yes stop_codon:yes gene_type:complete
MNTSKGVLAEIMLEHGNFNFVKNGDHVLCSITQKIIPIEELKYWNVDLQEVYASPEVALKRFKELNEV